LLVTIGEVAFEKENVFLDQSQVDRHRQRRRRRRHGRKKVATRVSTVALEEDVYLIAMSSAP
jgi:hypothetical protein